MAAETELWAARDESHDGPSLVEIFVGKPSVRMVDGKRLFYSGRNVRGHATFGAVDILPDLKPGECRRIELTFQE